MSKSKYPTFEYSMMTSYEDYSKQWEILKYLYNTNFINKKENNNIEGIPKIIHQIWLGSELPNLYLQFSDTWIEYHPDWEYILWTDKKVKTEKIINYNIYNKAENYGAKSDILRYEILNKYGGLYVDTDFICLKPFDELNNCLEFYTGIHTHSKLILPNGLIGCVRNHPIIKDIIKRLSAININNYELQNSEKLMKTVGPSFYTESVMKYIKSDIGSKIVVFPSTYFYPSPNYERNKGIDYMKKYIKSESFAIHLWEVSWVKNAKRHKNGYLKKVLRKLIKYLRAKV